MNQNGILINQLKSLSRILSKGRKLKGGLLLEGKVDVILAIESFLIKYHVYPKKN
jgi:hypothetical protein